MSLWLWKLSQFVLVLAYNPTNGLVWVAQSKQYPKAADDLAKRLYLPVVSLADPSRDLGRSPSFIISLEPHVFDGVQDYKVAITPVKMKNPKLQQLKLSGKPLSIDFLERKRSGPDLLLKSVCPQGLYVVDATAGYGQDSRVLAQGGAEKVLMVERDPIVFALLQDAHRRLQAAAHKATSDSVRQSASDLAKRMELVHANATDILKHETPDVVYLDPMFPPRKKSGLVKKNMQILQGLLENAIAAKDDEDLIRSARAAAKIRTVVKRPIHSTCLGNQEPSYSLRGSVNRWDVYGPCC